MADLKTLPELLLDQARRRPEVIAARGPDGEEITYKELWDQVSRVRAYLESQGVRPADRVALVAVSSVPFTVALFGILSAGATAVPLNYRLPAADIEWMLEDSAVTALFADERYLKAIGGKAREIKSSGKPVISLLGKADGAVAFETALAATASDAQRTPAKVPLDQAIYVLYTSGTTARPKGVEETHRGYAITAAGPQPIPSEAIKFLNALPLYHLAGLASLSVGIARGSQQILLDRFAPESFLDAVEKYKPNMTFLVPTMMCDLIESGLLPKFDISSIKAIAYGAAPTPVPVLLKMIEAFRQTMFIQLYSQTEGTSRVTMLSPQDHFLSKNPAQREKQIKRLSSIGKVMEGVEVRVCDAEGKEVSPGEVGELWYKTPGKMQGYLNRESDTKSTLRDGWIVSGDMVRGDEDGYVYIVGRSKDFLIRGGENIAPREIEEALESHLAVAEAAVVGRPDPRWGEAVVAFVRCPGASKLPSEDELLAHCKERLAGFKVPERVWFLENFPRNSLGKILKRDLVEEAKKRSAGT